MRKYFTIILLTATTLGCELPIPEPHSLEYDEERFDALAKEILNQSAIYEMDDFTRYTKQLNGVSLRTSRQPSEDGYGSFVDSVVDSLGINRTAVESLRQQLEKTKLREFYKQNDTVLFVVDGLLDTSWGFLYSSKQLQSDTIDFQFGQFIVRYVDSVNRYWRKVGIN